MVVVYFESGSHAEIAAIFPDEAAYQEHEELLHKQAEEANMIVTESVRDWQDIDQVLEASDRLEAYEQILNTYKAGLKESARREYNELTEAKKEEFREYIKDSEEQSNECIDFVSRIDPVEVVVAYGEDWSDAISNGEVIAEWEANTFGGSVIKHTFSTEAEAKAFKQGLEAGDGWLKYWILDQQDRENYGF